MKLYNYCKRCGKRLKGDENRLRGYGKICFQRSRMESKVQELVTSTPINTPMENRLKSKGEEVKNLQSKAESRAKESSEQGKEQEFKAWQGKAQGKAQSKGQGKAQSTRAMHESKAQGSEVRAKQTSSEQGEGAGETPHLEKTLSPTYKKPLLFTPHTPPPPTL